VRRRALLAAVTASLAGCGGGEEEPPPTARPPSSTPTRTDRPTPTPTASPTPVRTVSPATRREVRGHLSSAVRELDERTRRQRVTGPARSFDPKPVQERLTPARRAVAGTTADHLRAFVDAVSTTLAAVRAYADVVAGVREALSLHRARRFRDAAGRFGGLAGSLSTATVDRSTAVATLEAIPTDRLDGAAVERGRLAGTLAYLDDALTGIEAVVVGGGALETGVGTFVDAERQFASESYRSAVRTYRDAAGSLADAVDGFETDRPLAEFPGHVGETLDTHWCRADAYLRAAGRMRVAAERWNSAPRAAADAYDTARETLARDCVVVEWSAPPV